MIAARRLPCLPRANGASAMAENDVLTQAVGRSLLRSETASKTRPA